MRRPQDLAHHTLILLGHSPRAHIASGMEGHVFDIGNGRVAKVWHVKRANQLESLQAFYQMLDALDLPFATPVMEELHDVDGLAVSIEAALPGRPIGDLVDVEQEQLPAFAIDAVMSVLTALRHHPPTAPGVSLPVLDVASSEAHSAPDGVSLLLDIAANKVEKFGSQLRHAVRDFDVLYARLVERLQGLISPTQVVVHGDLCPPNIFLDEDRRVSAVIDWGFLTHMGDSAFDVSIACGTYDMYGPFARTHDDTLVSAAVNTHGYDRSHLLLHRALYSVLTSNAYSEDGSDGHFEWCAAMLNRADVREALFA